MSQRFFVSEPIANDRVSLGGDEGHHLARVMRAQPGDLVILFNDSGVEFEARIESVGRSTVELQVIVRREVDRELTTAVTLGVALPKGDRQKFLIEKAVELGVATLVPLETERGVAQPTDSARERLCRAVIEASKQCGRNCLMQIAEATAACAYFESADRDAKRLIAHPVGEPLLRSFGVAGLTESGVICGQSGQPRENPSAAKDSRPLGASVFLAVGPEGGFTEEEVSRAAALGWKTVTLGPRILRVETAALTLAAWCGFVSE